MYSIIIVDTFNLYFSRTKGGGSDIHRNASNVITYIETDIKRNLDPNGKLILLFDPIPKVDLQERYFKTYAARAELNPTYKANRKKNPKDIEAISLIYQYFNSREGFYIAKDNLLEADDFVERIVEKFPDKKISLCTTDMDWARFLKDDRIVMIQSFDWNNPFTEKSFFEKYNYKPTIASVTLHKALFGDNSDNITGALCEPKSTTKTDTKRKKIKFFTPDLKAIAKQWVSEIAESQESLSTVVKRIKAYNWTNLVTEPITNEKKVISAMEVAETQKMVVSPISTFMNNLQLIQTRCKNLDLYIHKTTESKTVKSYVENLLGLKIPKPLTSLHLISIVQKRLHMNKISKKEFLDALKSSKTSSILITGSSCIKCKKIKEDFAADMLQTHNVSYLVADDFNDKENTKELTDWLMAQGIENVPVLVIVRDNNVETFDVKDYADVNMVLDRELE